MTNYISALNVLLHNEIIGTITHLGNDRTIFSFHENYINQNNRPVLSLSFKDRFGQLIKDFNITQTKLLPFFSNLLPEETMRNYLAELASVNPVREFFLLWALGQDLAGAVTVMSANQDMPPADTKNQDLALNQENKAMRFSLAGIQLKFSAIQHKKGGLTIPANGNNGSWIVKLPSSRFEHVPENEYSMMKLAKLIGINVPEINLVAISEIENIPEGIETLGGNAFVINRFDRNNNERIHIEDFAQVFGVYPHHKYKKASMRNIAEVISSEGQEDDIKEFIRRLVFNTLIGNADMHLKNWSLIYKDKINASLAPAYDFISTIPYIPDDSAGLKVSSSKKFSDFTFSELSHLATNAKLSEKIVLDTAKETVETFNEIWQKEKNHLPLSSSIIKAIDKHYNSLPLLQSSN